MVGEECAKVVFHSLVSSASKVEPRDRHADVSRLKTVVANKVQGWPLRLQVGWFIPNVLLQKSYHEELLAAAVHYFWRERNLRILKNKALDAEQVTHKVVSAVRDFLCTRKNIKASQRNKELCAQ